MDGKSKKGDWAKESLQLLSDVAEDVKDVGVPGVGLVAKFINKGYAHYLESRLQRFCEMSGIDEQFLQSVRVDEDQSSCVYAAFETVRRTHSRLGLVVLALIFKKYKDDQAFLIGALRAFAEVSDETIDAFIEIHESIPADKSYIRLSEVIDGEEHFHRLYPQGIELITRGIFLMAASASMHANAPVQIMSWDHTKQYYKLCLMAKGVANHSLQARRP